MKHNINVPFDQHAALLKSIGKQSSVTASRCMSPQLVLLYQVLTDPGYC